MKWSKTASSPAACSPRWRRVSPRFRPASPRPTSSMAESPIPCCSRFIPKPASARRLLFEDRQLSVVRSQLQIARNLPRTTDNGPLTMKHFTSIGDCSPEELRHLLDVSARLKKQYKAKGCNDPILNCKTLAMIFEKPSLRTRVSFAVAMTHLGGQGLLLGDERAGLDGREAVE